MFSICGGNPWLLLLSRTQVPEKFADAALTTQMPVRNMRATPQPIRTFFIATSLEVSDKLQFVGDVRVQALAIATNECPTNFSLSGTFEFELWRSRPTNVRQTSVCRGRLSSSFADRDKLKFVG